MLSDRWTLAGYAHVRGPARVVRGRIFEASEKVEVVPAAEADRLRAALRQAEIRLFQIDRDRRERDKVFATAASARAEIARALDEGEETR